MARSSAEEMKIHNVCRECGYIKRYSKKPLHLNKAGNVCRGEYQEIPIYETILEAMASLDK